jgi:hypothetical protein
MERTKKVSNEKGVRGVGALVKLDGNKVRIDFENGEPAHIVVSQETIPQILLDVIEKLPVNAKTGVDATLDITGTKILFAKPLNGTFDLKFIKFWAKEGENPVMETKDGKKGTTYRQFSAVLEVQKITGSKSELWKGARFTVFFFDKFDKNEDGNLTVQTGSESADFLNDFMDVIGAGKHQIKASENPLPEIEKIALAEDITFSGDVRRTVSKKSGELYANVVSFNTYNMGEIDLASLDENVDDVHPALAE